MILDILNNVDDVSAIHDTYIASVPKVKNPSLVRGQRSISHCNVVYKLGLYSQ